MSFTNQTQEQTQQHTMSATEIQQLNERVAQLEELVKRLSGATEPEKPKEEVKEPRKKTKRNEEGQALNKDGSVRKARTPSGWDLFSKEKRATVTTELFKGEEKVKATVVASELGRLWRELGEEGQAEWKAKAVAE